jgi:DNA-binding GntR family transcriptional regulator
LDTVAELATKYGVARMTVQRAINELRDEGLVVSWQGRGTFVRDRGGSQGTSPATGPFDAIMERLDSMYDELRQVEQRVADLEAANPPSTGRARKRGS